MILLLSPRIVSGIPLFLSQFSTFRTVPPFSPLFCVDNDDTSISNTTNNKASIVTKDETAASQSTHQHRKRNNRPGMNSYLKVTFQNNDFLSRLHSTIVNLQLPSGESNQVNEMDPSSHDSNESLPKFRIRSMDSLHMTLFFGGEILCNSELSREDIRNWYNQIQDRFAESGFYGQSSSSYSKVRPQQIKDEFWFQFVKLRTFPPGRHYLIVAELEASPAWHDLYQDLQTIASDSECVAFKEIGQSNKKQWVPHVTLANISIRSRAGATAMNECLEKASDSLDLREEKIVASGITIGGPVPLKDELDWSFIYRGY